MASGAVRCCRCLRCCCAGWRRPWRGRAAHDCRRGRRRPVLREGGGQRRRRSRRLRAQLRQARRDAGSPGRRWRLRHHRRLHGRANKRLIEFVARTVEVTGEVTERAGRRTIRVREIKLASPQPEARSLTVRTSYPVPPGVQIEPVTVVWIVLAFAVGAAVTWVLVRQQAAARIAALEVRLQASDERHTILSHAEQTLRDAFRSMASEALQANSQSLTALAQASLEKTNEQVKGDLDRRHAAIADLVRPLADTLQAVDLKLGVVEKDRIAANASLAEQLKQVGSGLTSLQGETGKLVKALRQPHVRGHWGEVQLRQVVELAGMIEHTDFLEQVTLTTEDGRFRPDLVVRLPGGKRVIVDAKAPLAAYFDAVEAQDDVERAAEAGRPRPSGARPSGAPGQQGLLEPVRRHAGVRRDVPARRGAVLGRVVARPAAHRARHRQPRRPGQPDDADRAAQGRVVRLAAGTSSGQRAGDLGPGARALPAPAGAGHALRRREARAGPRGRRVQPLGGLAGNARAGHRPALPRSRRIVRRRHPRDRDDREDDARRFRPRRYGACSKKNS